MTPSIDLRGKTALVTGASSGLGRHFANVLSKAGASVAVCARREDKIVDLAANIEGNGGKALAIGLDVTDGARFDSCFDAIEAALGPVDILINNAGTAGNPVFWDGVTMQDWDQVLNVNLRATWALSQLMCKRLQACNRSGAIVNVSSLYGLREGLLRLPYNVSKAAVVQLTKTLAAELLNARLPIRVNALCPGYFATELNQILDNEAGRRYIERSPAGRFGNYEELDGALLLLVGDAGSFITGAVLAVDGGHSVKPV